MLSARVPEEGKLRPALSLLTASVLVAACGASASSSHPSPSPSYVAVSPTPAATAGTALNCRLPVAGYMSGATNVTPETQVGAGGFVEFPSGNYTPVAASDKSYLASADAWLPVSPESISPDGKTYVQVESRTKANPSVPVTTLYLVDVKTGTKRVLLKSSEREAVYALSWISEGIYAIVFRLNSGEATRLIHIDPATGASQAVAGSDLPNGAFGEIIGDAAWGTSQIFANGPPVRLLRLGLRDGKVTVWYENPTPFVIVGFDADNHPIIATFNFAVGSSQVTLVTAPLKTSRIETTGGSFLTDRPVWVTDSHGTWMAGLDGTIWLYSSGAGLRKVASVPAQPGGSGHLGEDPRARSIAGPCV